ncbi:MAG: 5'/3'-nucleotidase SurE [Rhodopirellula sp.]|nr:5'/3'-nucleotidase SurE [Rhodopirellula sp.]
MRVLLTNDDGIEADGLLALHKSVQQCFGNDVEIMVVAPDRGRSECGHSVTTNRALKINQLRPGWLAVDGTPVDCVRAAFGSLQQEFDLVFSGVNAGANLGVDLLVSGTFAAAREAAMHGIPAMAISHYRHPDIPKTWGHVPRWVADILQDFREMAEMRRNFGEDGTTNVLWNVNLPAILPEIDVPPTVRCGVDTKPMIRQPVLEGNSLRFASDFHGRPREPRLDVDMCFNGHMTISEFLQPFSI